MPGPREDRLGLDAADPAGGRHTPPRLRLDIEKRYAAFSLHVRLDAGPGVLVLFGASGAGKTTTLNAIAGLVRPDHGEIVLGDRVFFRRDRTGAAVDLPARLRRVGYVMQDYALFPHMTAADNIGFALRDGGSREARTRALLDRVSMAHLADRRPDQLSGGQQQRVAIARALAGDTRVLLLDEPFAALDAPVRERLQRDLRALRHELDLLVVLVTHRLEDAFAIGDRIAVLHDGRIAQEGQLDEVFRRPASRGVADVMGIRNLIHARILEIGPVMTLDWDGLRLEAPADPALEAGTAVTAHIRPDDIKIVYPDRPAGPQVAHNVFDTVISSVRQTAAARVLRARLPNQHELEIRFPLLSYSPLALEPGAPARIAIRREGIVVLGSG
ncbi:MAG: ABC transporter ATP-binding protein [Gemmatimonadetes bacterium]|nr:ABC transporter ATP-binding protein [Gemmatimonadota bacterium]